MTAPAFARLLYPCPTAHQGPSIEWDSASAQPVAGDATLDTGTPAGIDCKFTWNGYLLPARRYVARLGDMYQWQLPSPIESPLFLSFKASQVGASASP